MTDITELAQILKAAAEKWQEAWGKYDKVEITIAEFIRAANQYESIVKDPANILALVEALEKAQQRIGKLEKKLTDHKRMNQEMAKAMLTPNDSDAAGMEIAALRQRIAELESRAVKLPLPSCTYADHSYPAYSKRQVISLLESLGITVVEGDV
ncbi:ead/Ea22-like family protein [Klebsiella quasipneumoniae]|uniref:ead/Ea22-like family protein n=1 Tax=Klebsiella quasipneumoniae TaxID=1463165 RepID=UPI0024497A1C|nr:ead/Ea22-like family protein [Klebsiella quasipneumoniae]MDH2674336.1 ead/Ea22-like family protein [Klebsiella quasipneumoniae]MDH2684401.1 ead/Ea22-like family protein [Klebsiella quasipneumoniae]